MARSFDGAKRDDWRRRLAKFDSSGLRVVEFYDANDTGTVFVTVTGVNDPASISGIAHGDVTEDDDLWTLSVAGKLTVLDVDDGENAFNTEVTTAAANARRIDRLWKLVVPSRQHPGGNP